MGGKITSNTRESLSKDAESAGEKFKYCPVCKSRLKKREVCDILVVGLGCMNNHRFFVPLELIRPPAHQGQFLTLQTNCTSRDDIAKAWLANADLRRHLNNSVAEVLRLFLEIKDGLYDRAKQDEASKKGIDKFCAKCGEAVTSVGGDGYMVDYCCSNAHKFSERGYRLTFLHDERWADGGYLELCLDRNYASLFGGTKCFITNPEWVKMITPQVLEILKQYADEFSKE